MHLKIFEFGKNGIKKNVECSHKKHLYSKFTSHFFRLVEGCFKYLMMKFYAINGKIIAAEKAKIGLTDLALLRAFGIFEYFRFVDGKPIFMEDHLDRLGCSANLMSLEIPFSRSELKNQILELAKVNKVVEASVHLILTGGYSEDVFTPSKPNLIILVKPYMPPPLSRFQNGTKLLLWKHKREIPEVKTINYIVPILSLKKRAKVGASDILYHDGKYISECSRANIFMVTHDGKLVTANKGVLKGVTRKHTLEVAKNVCKIAFREISIEEIKNAQEVFITSSSQRIMPVVQIDDCTIGNGKPGAITLQLANLLQSHIEKLHEKVVY